MLLIVAVAITALCVAAVWPWHEDVPPLADLCEPGPQIERRRYPGLSSNAYCRRIQRRAKKRGTL